MGKMPSEGTTGKWAWGSHVQARKTKADIPGGSESQARSGVLDPRFGVATEPMAP